MYVEELELINFRNYEHQKINFNNKLNVIVGKNAQGKTNLIEAIFLLAIGRSPRTTKDKEMINWDKDRAVVKMKLVKNSGSKTLEIRLSKNAPKTILINGLPIRRISELISVLNVIYFFPEDLKLIKEAPQDRRRFMDVDISQASRNYFFLLQTYEKVLMQRNKLLKNSSTMEVLKQTVGIWNEQLADVASKIIISRIKFLNKLAPIVQKCHAYLSNDNEKLDISYQGVVGQNTEEIKNILIEKLQQNLQKDFELGYTSVGPHRDDIKITLNGVDIRSFGSQGQQRTASLSLKLAEIQIFEEETKEKPILLLDDVLSELDPDRQRKLINIATKQQSFLTCTDYPFDTVGDIYNIKEGSCLKS